MQSADTLAFLTRYRAEIIAAMRQVLDKRPLAHYGMMRYHLGWETVDGKPHEGVTGKMLRPTLCLLACEAVGGDYRCALPAAAGIELLHNFSLIHDDIEDSSEKRHGRKTVWSLWGPAQAINVGDGLFTLAHLAMYQLEMHTVPPRLIVTALRMLDEACLALCEGQYRDLAFQSQIDVTIPDYMAMVAGKTGALMGAATAIGALLGGGSEPVVAALQKFGQELGVAFQIYDDYLGVWGDTAETGKSTSDDIRERKKSFPIVYTFQASEPADRGRLQALYAQHQDITADVKTVVEILNRARAGEATLAEAWRLADAAVASLAELNLVPERRRELIDLAHYIVNRRC